ncbi:MAG: ATP-binding cassette domain-containing protein [Desulfococcaceae bacterium]
MAILTLHDITLGFGGDPLLDGVDLTIESGERVCLLGRNGAGKSTLLRILAGEIRPDAGEILQPGGLRVARLEQAVPAGISGTVRDVVAGGVSSGNGEAIPEWEASQKAEAVLTRAGLNPEPRFENLSAGLKRRTLLARALAGEPDLLLLDEPTNHLDIVSVEWLEETLRRLAPTLLFVTHDRAFLKKLATRILELDRGRLTSFPGNYETYLARRAELDAAEAAQRERFEKKLAAEETWIRAGLKARRTRNEGRVRDLRRMRAERRAWRERLGDVQMQAREARRTGKLVIEATDVSYAWEEKPVVRNFSTIVTRGDRIGILGPNGAGKTTLLHLLLGRLEPDEGSVRHGTHLEVAYFDQLREQLDESATVADNLADGNDQVVVDGKGRHVISVLKDFLFTPDRARSPVSMLSGGERNRLLLARLFTRPSNVLVMDEPTNDLDMETLELLEELLAGYGGTVLLVSHDREFLNNVVTGTLVFEGEGTVTPYAGGYDDWLIQRPQPEAAAPKKEKNPQAEPRSRKARPRKMSFKEKTELAALPARIEALEAEQAELHRRMADPEFYKEAGNAVAETTRRLEALEAELETAYGRWEALEALAESEQIH